MSTRHVAALSALHRIAAIGFAVLLALLLAPLVGCKDDSVTLIDEPGLDKDYDAPLPPGQLALRKITDPSQVPDFTPALADTTGLAESIDRSLAYLAKPSSQDYFPYGQITHGQAVASLRAFRELIESEMTPQQLNAAIRARFDTYISVGYADNGIVLFTGYYTPILDGSLVQAGPYQHPLFKKPAGLTKNPDGSPTAPMPPRKEIEQSNAYGGQELIWLTNPFDAYIAHIQGSARIRLPDGKEMTVGYTANNGHEYRSIRAVLVTDGKIDRHAGLAEMRNYFAAHPDEIHPYTWQNPRFIFFEVVPDGRPRGSLNEPVTPWRTIATDKSIYPRACMAFVAAPLPRLGEGGVEVADYRGFALDQDTGGAIRAPGRCDVYMGMGKQAGDLAGRTKHEGRLYYLFLKPTEQPRPVLEEPAPATEN